MGIVENGTNIPVALWANYRFPAPESVAPSGDATAPAIIAYVNQGRWVADCPFGCGSAQVVAETDKRFYCCGGNGCQNYGAGNKTIPVAWPDLDLQAAIENLLVVRPPVFRNWKVGESLELLELENKARGTVN